MDVLLAVNGDLFAISFRIGCLNLFLVPAATTALTDVVIMFLFITYWSLLSNFIITWALAATTSMTAHRGSTVKRLRNLI